MDEFSIREIFPRRLQYFMSENSKSRNDLVRDLGFKYSTVRDWEKGFTVPRMEKVEMLANYFHCTTADLLEENEKPTATNDGLSRDRRELINRIKSLPEDKIQLLLQVAKSIE